MVSMGWGAYCGGVASGLGISIGYGDHGTRFAYHLASLPPG